MGHEDNGKASGYERVPDEDQELNDTDGDQRCHRILPGHITPNQNHMKRPRPMTTIHCKIPRARVD